MWFVVNKGDIAMMYTEPCSMLHCNFISHTFDFEHQIFFFVFRLKKNCTYITSPFLKPEEKFGEQYIFSYMQSEQMPQLWEWKEYQYF
jgi:hypothetical protein